MKPHELAGHFYLEQRGYPQTRPFRTGQLPDRSWLLWYDLTEGELLLHAGWKPSEWTVTTVYFEVD